MSELYVKRPDYFIADGVHYLFVDYERAACQLHGDDIGYSIKGREIKSSGYVGTSRCVVGLDSLSGNSRDCMARYIGMRKEMGYE